MWVGKRLEGPSGLGVDKREVGENEDTLSDAPALYTLSLFAPCLVHAKAPGGKMTSAASVEACENCCQRAQRRDLPAAQQTNSPAVSR